MSKGKKGNSKKRVEPIDITKIIILTMLCSLALYFLHEAFIKPIERIECSFGYDTVSFQISCSFYKSDNYSAQVVD